MTQQDKPKVDLTQLAEEYSVKKRERSELDAMDTPGWNDDERTGGSAKAESKRSMRALVMGSIMGSGANQQ